MSASTQQPDELNSDITRALEGGTNPERAERIHEGLTEHWGLPVTITGEGGQQGVPISQIKQHFASDPDVIAERYGDEHFFLRAVAAGPEYLESDHEIDTIERAFDPEHDHWADADETQVRAVVDKSIVGAATPVEFDPMIVDIQRSAAPVVTDYIRSVAQAGFTASYNVISDRDDPVGFLSESEAVDLSSNTPQSFTLTNEQKDMKIHVSLINVSDFSQRAEDTLDYMDLRDTTLGQAVIAHTLQKARAFFYGDPSGTDAGDQSIEDADAYEGMAKIFDDAGNSTDKSTVSSGFMEDLLDVLTTKVTNTGLTWDRARFLVSPQFYNAVYDEVTPVVRLDGYDADVEFGPQGLALGSEMGTVNISPCPNIRSYSGFSKTAASSDPGDVFLIDELALQYRQLAPMSTVPLARVGLSDRAALFEYGTLIDKSQGEHGEWLQSYAI